MNHRANLDSVLGHVRDTDGYDIVLSTDHTRTRVLILHPETPATDFQAIDLDAGTWVHSSNC